MKNDNQYKSKIIYCLSMAIILVSFSNRLYAEEIKEHFKVWTSTQITGSITENKKWRYYFQPELRFLDDKYKFNQVDMYFGVYYQPEPTLSYWLGGFRRYTQLSNGKSQQEYRLWEQINWIIVNNDYLQFSSRNRLEERKNFIHAQIANRFREKLSLRFPIRNTEKTFVILADEVFLQLNRPKWVTNNFFAQNQASMGVILPLGSHTSYTIGYINQFQFTKPKQMSNILFVNLDVALD